MNLSNIVTFSIFVIKNAILHIAIFLPFYFYLFLHKASLLYIFVVMLLNWFPASSIKVAYDKLDKKRFQKNVIIVGLIPTYIVILFPLIFFINSAEFPNNFINYLYYSGYFYGWLFFAVRYLIAKFQK